MSNYDMNNYRFHNDDCGERFIAKNIEYDIYFFDTLQEFIDEEDNFQLDGLYSMSDEQILDYLNSIHNFEEELRVRLATNIRLLDMIEMCEEKIIDQNEYIKKLEKRLECCEYKGFLDELDKIHEKVEEGDLSDFTSLKKESVWEWDKQPIRYGYGEWKMNKEESDKHIAWHTPENYKR